MWSSRSYLETKKQGMASAADMKGRLAGFCFKAPRRGWGVWVARTAATFVALSCEYYECTAMIARLFTCSCRHKIWSHGLTLHANHLGLVGILFTSVSIFATMMARVFECALRYLCLHVNCMFMFVSCTLVPIVQKNTTGLLASITFEIVNFGFKL